jgi:hypothetical protein
MKTLNSLGRGCAAKALRKRSYIAAVTIIVALAFLCSHSANAQSRDMDWSAPINLSNSPQSSGRPAIVADGFGYVHVFWSEDVNGESILDIPGQLIKNGNTIFYTRWDGVSWTQPVDILFVPGDGIAEYVAVAVDKDNWLHAVWTGQSNYYHSSAPSWQAHSASSWSRPTVVATDSARTPWSADIVTDGSGNVHIVYATAGNNTGIHHTVSRDGGATWEVPTRLSGAFYPLEKSLSTVKVLVDGADRLHAVWQTNQAEGYGQAAYYARSVDGGDSWTQPVQMGYRDAGEYDVSYPFLAAIGESELHLVYIDGPWHTGRWHRISRDGGATWSEPSHFIEGLEGVNGYTILLTDVQEGLHLIVTMRTLGQVGGLFYTRWSGNGWSPEQLAIPDNLQTGLGAHWTAATIRLGNEMHVLWNTNFSSQAGEIWHSRAVIPGVAQVAALPVPVIGSIAATPVATTVPAAQTASHVQSTPSANTFGQLGELPPSSQAPTSDLIPILISVAPAVLLIIGVIAWKRIRSQSS